MEANGQRPTRAQKDQQSRVAADARRQLAQEERAAFEQQLITEITHLDATVKALAEALDHHHIVVQLDPAHMLAVALGAALGDPLVPLQVQLAVLQWQANSFRSALERADEIVDDHQRQQARAALVEGVLEGGEQLPSGLIVPGA